MLLNLGFFQNIFETPEDELVNRYAGRPISSIVDEIISLGNWSQQTNIEDETGNEIIRFGNQSYATNDDDQFLTDGV